VNEQEGGAPALLPPLYSEKFCGGFTLAALIDWPGRLLGTAWVDLDGDAAVELVNATVDAAIRACDLAADTPLDEYLAVVAQKAPWHRPVQPR